MILQNIERSNPKIQMCYVSHFKIQVRENCPLLSSPKERRHLPEIRQIDLGT